MTNQFKRIIAREGLVLLGIVGIGCVIMMTPETYIKPKPIMASQTELLVIRNYASSLQGDERQSFIDKFNSIKDDDSKISILASRISQLTMEAIPLKPWEKYQALAEVQKFREKYPEYNDIDDLTLVTKLARKYPQYNDLLEKVKSMQNKEVYHLSEATNATEQQNKVRNIGLIIFLLGYPVYLLVKFIIWAVKTLKSKA